MGLSREGPGACSGRSAQVGAVFLEVHDDPEKALSDGPNMVRLSQLRGLLEALKEIDRVRTT